VASGQRLANDLTPIRSIRDRTLDFPEIPNVPLKDRRLWATRPFQFAKAVAIIPCGRTEKPLGFPYWPFCRIRQVGTIMNAVNTRTLFAGLYDRVYSGDFFHWECQVNLAPA
jgi:hypothetical protein